MEQEVTSQVAQQEAKAEATSDASHSGANESQTSAQGTDAGGTTGQASTVASEPGAGDNQEQISNSKKLSLLAKREQRARQQEAEAKARLKEVDAKFAQVEEFNKRLERVQKKDPQAVKELYQQMGISYLDLSEMELFDYQQKPKDKVEQLEEQVRRLSDEREAEAKAKVDAAKQSQEAQAKAANDQALKVIATALKTNDDQFELINLLGRHDLVYDRLLNHYEKTGDSSPQTIIRIAQETENDFVDEFKKYITSNKLRQLFTADEDTDADSASKSTPSLKTQVSKAPSASKSIRNNSTRPSVSAVPKDWSLASPEEKAEAMKRLAQQARVKA